MLSLSTGRPLCLWPSWTLLLFLLHTLFLPHRHQRHPAHRIFLIPLLHITYLHLSLSSSSPRAPPSLLLSISLSHSPQPLKLPSKQSPSSSSFLPSCLFPSTPASRDRNLVARPGRKRTECDAMDAMRGPLPVHTHLDNLSPRAAIATAPAPSPGKESGERPVSRLVCSIPAYACLPIKRKSG